MTTNSNPMTDNKATAEQAIRRIIHICEARKTIGIAKNDHGSAQHNEEVKCLAEIALRGLLA